jgi:hypothetical protein
VKSNLPEYTFRIAILEMSSGFAGGRVHPGSGLQEGPKNENIQARSDVIRAIPADAIICPKKLGRGKR